MTHRQDRYPPSPLILFYSAPSPTPPWADLSPLLSISIPNTSMPPKTKKPTACPKLTFDDLTHHCDTYFECSSDSWSWEDFVAHFVTFAPFKMDIVNYKWTGALRSIEASLTETSARRSKAQSLLDRHQILSVIKLLPSSSSFLLLTCQAALGSVELVWVWVLLAMPALVPQERWLRASLLLVVDSIPTLGPRQSQLLRFGLLASNANVRTPPSAEKPAR